MQTSFEIRERLNGVQATNAAAGAGPAKPEALVEDAETSVASDATLTEVSAPGVFGLVELILKDRPRLERIIHDPSLSAELIPRFLAAALMGFTLFGVTLAIVLAAVGVEVKLHSVAGVLEGESLLLIDF